MQPARKGRFRRPMGCTGYQWDSSELLGVIQCSLTYPLQSGPDPPSSYWLICCSNTPKLCWCFFGWPPLFSTPSAASTMEPSRITILQKPAGQGVDTFWRKTARGKVQKGEWRTTFESEAPADGLGALQSSASTTSDPSPTSRPCPRTSRTGSSSTRMSPSIKLTSSPRPRSRRPSSSRRR